MLKKTITYTDFNGKEVSEDFYFHLSKAELIELELSHEGGLTVAINKIIESNDGKAVIKEFKGIVLMAYGQKSEDGRRFIKNQQLREEFESTEAYSTLFFELVTDADAAAEFMNGVIPFDLAAELEEQAEPKVMTMAQVKALSVEEQAELTDKIASKEVRIEG